MLFGNVYRCGGAGDFGHGGGQSVGLTPKQVIQQELINLPVLEDGGDRIAAHLLRSGDLNLV